MRRVSSESRLPAEQTSSTSIDLDWLIPFIGAFEKHHPPPDEKTHTNTHSNRPQQGHFPPTVKNCAKQTEEHAGGTRHFWELRAEVETVDSLAALKEQPGSFGEEKNTSKSGRKWGFYSRRGLTHHAHRHNHSSITSRPFT